MLSKAIIELFYQAAHIQRWNDHIRPRVGFTELDKQAHKMIIAYVLAKFEETERKVEINWKGLIEGGLFEFLHRIILTDIKPPIFHKLMRRKGKELNEWVLDQLKNKIDIQEKFFKEFREYLFLPISPLEKKILRAAHYLATNWEFRIIYNLNKDMYGLESTKAAIENELKEHIDLIGVQRLVSGKINAFIDYVGQLRFQQRWAQTPRLPETSVMGHMLVVAMLSNLFSIELNACSKRIVNNYFTGLFHDLPEVLTRDIVSPVKKSVEGLRAIIEEIEKEQLEEKLLPLLPSAWHKDFRYFIEDEFESKIKTENNEIKLVSSEKINESFNSDSYSPVDGKIIKICDDLAAYVETYFSISHGITSEILINAHNALYNQYKTKKVAGIDFGELFEQFNIDIE
ncbi:HD domain-containing protein [Candidatus Borrarchaeum sp.]|uniref:HD domain-containing protein n=1 Tax=Candidatus Borrarchaeum sp. TaxID=2846742 RepID=UPI00257CAB5A|nr:HD domain-containing protein [Candidatus Borrarchaeum sp.]